MKAETPLRITLGGGGTDLPEFYEQHGGFVCSMAIDLKVRVEPDSTGPIWATPEQLACNVVARGTRIESDVSVGSGLGGSGAIVVSMLRLKFPNESPRNIATAAYNIERYVLNRHTGWQDHFIAAYGGAKLLQCDKNGFVDVHELPIPAGFLDRLALFHTGITRQADCVLSKQAETAKTDPKYLKIVKDIGISIADDLRRKGDLFGLLTHRHWLAKKESCNAISTPQIDEWYEIAQKNGAIGGKCCGAGAGGYMLFVCKPDNREKLVCAMEESGLKHTKFAICEHGARVL
jgi:D-glycero-alpha-D-manno-heptose-7-phosphate kinase